MPRFGVVQGVKEDGEEKVRPVDNFSWAPKLGASCKRKRADVKASSVNGHSACGSKVGHDHLDDLWAAMCLFVTLFGVVSSLSLLGCPAQRHSASCTFSRQAPWLWKADIDSAFRRVPITSRHKWAAGIAYRLQGRVWTAVHQAMPFGATSSVEAWHRVGDLLTTIARRLLHLPVFRYADDFFSLERCASMLPHVLTSAASFSVRRETVEHAMSCFARVTKRLLGQTAIAVKKLQCGAELLILGMQVQPFVLSLASRGIFRASYRCALGAKVSRSSSARRRRRSGAVRSANASERASCTADARRS